MDESIGRQLDPEIVGPNHVRCYADPMKATPALVLATANCREKILGDFRGAADLFPNGNRVVFPGMYGFVQHVLPVPCARVGLDWVRDLDRR